jgi:hypothetical protein
MKTQINLAELASIVKREFIKQALHESDDINHKEIAEIVAAATKLAEAIKKFETTSPPMAHSAVTQELTKIKKALDNMVTNPISYVTQSTKKKTVKLAPVQS